MNLIYVMEEWRKARRAKKAKNRPLAFFYAYRILQHGLCWENWRVVRLAERTLWHIVLNT